MTDRRIRRNRHGGAPLGVIDIGTNSALLLIVQRSGNKLVSLHEESQTPRLGTGLAETGRITTASVGRLINTLRQYQRKCKSFGVVKIIPVGTRVFRIARNSHQVIKEAVCHTGLQINVLSSAQEASYAFRGVLSGMPRIQNGIVVDVGGGSTEFVVFRKRDIVYSISFPLGAVVFAETVLRRFWHISDARLARARNVVDGHFCRFPPEYRRPSGCIIGVGGTITTLAALDRRLKKYRPDHIQGADLVRNKIGRYLDRFRRMTIADIRRAIPFDRARARVLPAGTFIWIEVLKHLTVRNVTISHRGLRWGVAEDFLRKSGPGRG